MVTSRMISGTQAMISLGVTNNLPFHGSNDWKTQQTVSLQDVTAVLDALRHTNSPSYSRYRIPLRECVPHLTSLVREIITTGPIYTFSQLRK
jgi:hypothetical protein